MPFGEHGRIRGFHDHDSDIRVLALEIFANAGHRAARSGTRDKDVHLAVGVFPDFRAGGRAVNRGVRGVVKLAGDERVRRARGELLRLCDGALHALRALCEHDLRAISAHQNPALHAHRLRHGDDEAIAARRRDGGKADARVSAGGLDDDAAFFQHAAALCIVDHRERDAILYAAAGVEVFEFCDDLRVQAILLFIIGELQQRGLSNQFRQALRNLSHMILSLFNHIYVLYV